MATRRISGAASSARRPLPATTADDRAHAALIQELNREALDASPIQHPLQAFSRLGAALAGNVVESGIARQRQDALDRQEAKDNETRRRLADILRGGGIAPDLPGSNLPLDFPRPSGVPQITMGGILDAGDTSPLPANALPANGGPADGAALDANTLLLGGAAQRPPSAIAPLPVTPAAAPAAVPGMPGAGGGGAPSGAMPLDDAARRRRALAAQLAAIPGMEDTAVQLALKDEAPRFQNVADPAALGLPKGTVAQIGANGQIHIVSKPDKPEKPIAPVVHTFFDDQGREYNAQWDAESGQWKKIGGSKAAPTDKEDRTLVEIADPTSPTGTKYVERRNAIGQPGKPSAQGMTIFDGQGRVVAQIGGKGGKGEAGGDMAAPAKAELDKQILANEARVQTVADIVASYDPSYLTAGTQLRNKVRSWKGRILGDDALSDQDRQALTNFATFRARTFRDMNEQLKNMSGSAVTPQEFERQTKVLADAENDDPVTFKANLDDTQRFITLAHARLLHARREGLDPQKVPLRDVENAIQQRGKALDVQLQQDYPDDRRRLGIVRATLKREYGI